MMKSPAFVLAILGAMFLNISPGIAVPKQACLNVRDARAIVTAKHLIEPFQVMKSVGALSRAEPVSIRLCNWEETFVYEVVLLHPQGRLLRVFVDGITGKTVSPKPE